MLDALDETGFAESTLLFVVSDHGGIGTRHGGATDAEVLVPWVVRGPGIRKGMDLGPFAKVEDTASTVVAAFGARQPAAWTARPLLSAFEWHPVPEISAPAAAPVHAVAGESVEVRVSANAPDDGALELSVDWGDGAPLIWHPAVASGEARVFTHRYLRPGTYTARARAAAGGESISNATAVGVFEIAPDPAVPIGLVGLWEFADAENPHRATHGEDLVMEGRPPAHHARLADGREEPRVANGVIVTTGGPGNHLRARHHIGGNGGGAKTNVFSMVFDVMPPADGGWHTFYQPDPANRADAAFFMRATPSGNSPPDSIGRGGIGYSAKPLARDQWHRVAITVDLSSGGAIRSYLDGELFHEHAAQPADGHWALDPRTVLFFADQDGENTPWAVAMAAIFDRALDADAVRALGAAGDPVISMISSDQP